MTERSAAIEFVDAAIERLRRYVLLRCPDPHMPAAMRDRSRPAIDDWLPWQPIPSSVTDGDINDLQNHIRGALPAAYVEFLMYLHFFEFPVRDRGQIGTLHFE